MKLEDVRRLYLALGRAHLLCFVRENSIVTSGSIEAEKFLNSCTTISFSRRAFLLCAFTLVHVCMFPSLFCNRVFKHYMHIFRRVLLNFLPHFRQSDV
jgi:hypothetical protein